MNIVRALVLVMVMIIAFGGRAVAGDGDFLDFPKIETRIEDQSGDGRLMSLQLTVELEAGSPRPSPEWQGEIMRAFEARLSRYKVVDLQGSAGMYRLRDDLLATARVVDLSVKVHDVLFERCW